MLLGSKMEQLTPKDKRRNYVRERYQKIKADPEKYQKLLAYYRSRYQKKRDLKKEKEKEERRNNEKKYPQKSQAYSFKPAETKQMDVTEPENISSFVLEPFEKVEPLKVTPESDLKWGKGKTYQELSQAQNISAFVREPLNISAFEPIDNVAPSNTTHCNIKPPVRIIPLLKGLLDFLQAYEIHP